MSLQLQNNLAREIVPPTHVALSHDDYFEKTDTMEDDFGPMDNDEIDFLLKNDPAYQHFIYNEVIPSIEAMKADPSSGYTIEEVRASLAALHAKRQ